MSDILLASFGLEYSSASANLYVHDLLTVQSESAGTRYVHTRTQYICDNGWLSIAGGVLASYMFFSI